MPPEHSSSVSKTPETINLVIERSSVAHPEPHPLPGRVVEHTLDNAPTLEASITQLMQTLATKHKELQDAQQATRDLAVWTQKERTRLMREALHQRFLREDCEAMLWQRDEQVAYLLALRQGVRPRQTQTLAREGETARRPVAMGDMLKINEMGVQIGSDGAVQGGPLTEGKARNGSAFEEGEIADKEGGYSQPDFKGSSTIDAQIDELIAGEKSWLTR